MTDLDIGHMIFRRSLEVNVENLTVFDEFNLTNSTMNDSEIFTEYEWIVGSFGRVRLFQTFLFFF